jgi:hypothetical protein
LDSVDAVDYIALSFDVYSSSSLSPRRLFAAWVLRTTPSLRAAAVA